MSAEMTPNPHIPEVFDVECKAHTYERTGLAYAHALNAMKKHNREQHPEPVYRVGALAALVADAWDEWTDAIADGLDDPDVAHKATPLQRRFLTLREAWMTVLGLEDDTQALAEARVAAHENHYAVRPTF